MFREKKPISKLFLLAAVLSGVVVCDDSFGLRLTTESSGPRESTQYRFHYFVKDETTGEYKVQEETKTGDSVWGSYTIADPNGDLRTVTYKAGPGTGFEAKVNIHPSGSPMKATTEGTTTKTADVKMATTLESKVKRFPGGFAMNLTSPQTDVRTEMGMKVPLKANPVTEPVTVSMNTFTAAQSTSATTMETVGEVGEALNTTAKLKATTAENSTIPTEGRGMIEDEIEKEIDEVINSMPKMPELVLSDNKTHFKFHKDPEEALLDERITQIARQLAETSLRREYEERKLGHVIPISLSPIESSTADYLLKSFKFTGGEGTPRFRPSEPSTLHVLTQLKVAPQYVYKQTLIPRISPLNYRLPVVSRGSPKPEQDAYEVITDAEKANDSNRSKVKESYRGHEQTSVMPLQVPTFFQFFSPYFMHTTGSFDRQQKQEATTSRKNITKGGTENDKAVSSSVTPAITPAVNRTS